MPFVNAIAGVVLAGGAGRRIGGDKPMRLLGQRTLLAHVVDHLRPQVAMLAINANDEPERFAAFGLRVLPDAGVLRAGPLAGVAVGLRWARDAGFARLVTVACDTPFLPDDLVARLAAAGEADVVVAASQGRRHHTAALWRTDLADALAADLVAGSASAMHRWLAARHTVSVEFDGEPDPFLNINTPEELAAAASRASTIHPAPGV